VDQSALENTIRNVVRQMLNRPEAEDLRQVPIGAAVLWTGPTTKIPNGFTVLDGRNVKITDYAADYQIVGTSYNSGTPAGSFRLPNYGTVADSATATVGRWIIRYG
jgi:microcystin-dependent protein